ncbi:hypothetical protein BDR03DRAFT_945198 [Suillus americanus]|nr:hypothetical protein BDR03DRAFT_945198 [Suillus americanus]
MDVLPASCERVFLSSKDTCTLRRSRLSPQVMEALQILLQAKTDSVSLMIWLLEKTRSTNCQAL